MPIYRLSLLWRRVQRLTKPIETKSNVKAITSEQQEQIGRFIQDAARKGTKESVKELQDNGALDGDSLQKIISRGGQVSSRVKDFIKGLLSEMAEIVRGCLKLISGAETITLDSTDGTETIAKAKDTFNGYLDSDFRNWGLDVASQPTKEQKVSVHEMIKDGTFSQIFNGLSANLDSLCLTQAQIINFVKKYRKWLRTEGYGTFFLFKRGEDFFVAYVRVSDDGSLYVRVHKLARGNVWRAGYRHRVVVPQLEPATL